MNKKLGIIAVLGVVGLGSLVATYDSLMGHNNSGQRQFVQTWTGNEKTEFDPGPYWQGGGGSTPYNDVLTLNNSAGPNDVSGGCSYANGDGFPVQYADGGKGVICVQAQFPLPTDPVTMKALHKRFRSEDGVRVKLMDATLRSLFTNTAKLFTSPEAYSTKSTDIQVAINDQIINGSYKTEIEVRQVEAGVDKAGKVIYQQKEFAIITKAKDKYDTNPLAEFNMNTAVKVQITGFDFEPDTIKQIADRRDATNRAQTAQDKAKAAYWEAEQEKAEGEKARVIEEFKQKKLAEIDIQKAEKAKKLALIDAAKQEETAKLLEAAAIARTEQAKQDAIAAKHEAEKIKTLADANAYEVDAMQKAGELFKQIEADVTKNKDLANAIRDMNMPTNLTILGGGAEGGQTDDAVLQLMMVEKLNQLNGVKVKPNAN